METTTIQMNVPKELAPYLTGSGTGQDFDRDALLIYGLIQAQRLSHGRAAEILGVKKRDLIEYYNAMGLPYLRQSKEDLLNELKTWDRIRRNEPCS